MRRLWGASLLTLGLATFHSAEAASTFVGPVQSYSCSAGQFASALTASTGATSCSAITNYNQLPTIGGGTVLGNTGTSSTTPSATIAPVVGIPGTSEGSLGFAGSTAGTFTLEAAPNTTASYTLQAPAAAPSVSGQALTATTGGVGSWTTIATAGLTVTAQSSGPTTLTSANDRTFYKVTSGAVTYNMTSSLVAGDNWCFEQSSSNAVTISVNSVASLTFILGGGSGTTSLVSGAAGSTLCGVMDAATSGAANFVVYSMTGTWTLS
jgi:hypothetical protein